MTVINGQFLLSNSEAGTAQGCKRKWWLQWYRGLAPVGIEVQGVRSTGTRLHIALSVRYAATPGTVAQMMDALLQAQISDLEVFKAAAGEYGPDEKKLKKLVSDFGLEQAMLEGYIQWLEETGADSDLETVASETYVEAQLTEGDEAAGHFPVVLIGKLDARVRSNVTGRTKFIDHKSVQTLDTRLLRINPQMLHYHLLEFLNTGDGDARCDGALYNMLRRSKRTATAKPPFYLRESVDHNVYELRSYANRITGIAYDIQTMRLRLEAGKEPVESIVYPTSHRDCTWKCPFLKICPLFDDGSRVEAAIENLYVRQDPLHYYADSDREAEE